MTSRNSRRRKSAMRQEQASPVWKDKDIVIAIISAMAIVIASWLAAKPQPSDAPKLPTASVKAK